MPKKKREQVGFYTEDELQPLQNRNVQIPSLSHVCIGREVPLENIGTGVVLHPFCKIIGDKTKIYSKAQVGLRGPVTLENSIVGKESVIGSQGPVTLVDTVTGPKTVLGSGVAESAVFLGKETDINDFSTGLGFRTRKGSLYEEDSSSAQHTDTKMTILFPWVTLGSNINFCDLMLTGGVGPNLGDFTEVGSGTIHFNFTIRGDKATASLLGNVPEGVFLRKERLFIGGNNSLLGPLQADFGTLTAAGIRAAGVLKNGLNLGRGLPLGHTDYDPRIFSRSKEVIGQQVHYIGQLAALYHWYREIRFQLAQSNPELLELYQAGQKMVVLNIMERIAQVGRFVEALESSIHILNQQALPPRHAIEEQQALLDHWPRLKEHLENYEQHFWEIPSLLSNALEESAAQHSPHYTQIVQNLSEDSARVGKSWLDSIVHRCEIFFKSELKIEHPRDDK
ncbi:MAG: hypothetical protein HQM14_01210 [SAR324 cluster bacterium]|nr:hypothetical protein [SAR324 cluster bacterium]